MMVPEREEQVLDGVSPKYKHHLSDGTVPGSMRSERKKLLQEDSDEDDDFFMRGSAGHKLTPENDKLKQVQSQVHEVIDVMQENLSKVIERGECLEELQDKSETLADNASAFSVRAKHLHRRMWFKHLKMKLVIALVVLVLLLMIIVPVILHYQ